MQGAREHDKGQHRLIQGLEADDVGTKVRVVFRVWRLELAGRTDFVRGVAGHDLVDGGSVIEQTRRGVAHGIDQGELVVHFGQLWQDLGKVRAWDLRGDALEVGADLVGHVFFGVPEVNVTRTSLKVDHENMLGLSPTGAAGLGTGSAGGLGAKDVVQGQPHHRSAADTQDVTP